MNTRYLGVRPFGDSLISLSLLHQAPANIRLDILGTPIIKSVAAVTGLQRFPIHQVLPDVAAFFDLRVKGPVKALRDLLRVRRYLAQNVGQHQPLLVEQKDWRNRLMVPLGHPPAIEPPTGTSVYDDRRALIEAHFGAQLQLRQSRLPGAAVRSVLLHPGARQAARAFPHTVVAHVIDHARQRGIRVALVDPTGYYRDFADTVAAYLAAPPLADAIAALRASDMFIGADSFFLHLAYFYDVPLFCIANVPQPYFAPPGMLEQRACIAIADAVRREALDEALGAVLR